MRHLAFLALLIGVAGAPVATYVVQVSPRDGATGVSVDSAVQIHFSAGLNLTTFSNSSVWLAGPTGARVSVILGSDIEGDVISLKASAPLAARTTYTVRVTDQLMDRNGLPVTPFTSKFTTGDAAVAGSSFRHARRRIEGGGEWTVIAVGPDGHLYVANVSGTLFRIRLDPTTGLALGKDTLFSRPRVSILGLAFDPQATASRPVAWITYSDQYASTLDVGTFSGVLSRLALPPAGQGGAAAETRVVVGLPAGWHPLNGCEFGPDGRIYISCGSMNRMGWDPVRPETPLSAAVVVADVRNPAFNGGRLPLNVQTTSPVNYNAFATNAPLKLYATGFREMYGPVWHSNGSFYGGVNQNDGTTRASSPSGPGVPSLSQIFPNEDLVRIVPGGYYGHPNPTRFQYVIMGGNPTAGVDPWEVPEYPVGVLPDRNFNPANLLYNLARIGGTSANGGAEYTHPGPLQGRLLVCFYETAHTIHTFAFNASGTAVTDQRPLLDENGNPLTLNHPLDLAVHPSGRIYVADFGTWGGATQGADGGIWMLTPVATGGGGGTGLRGEYYDGPGFTQFRGTQVDPTVNFSWDSPTPDEFSVRWSGFVQPRYSETYTFHTVSDDGARLWVNGRLVIDAWADHNTREDRGTISLTADQRISIKLEYYKNGNHGEARLYWSSPRQPREIVPQSRLFTGAGTTAGGGGSIGSGFRGEYYDGVNFTNLLRTQTDPSIDFTFQSAAPDDFSVIWTGTLEPPSTEHYTFRTLTDDGVRLWVNGRLLIDHWQDHNSSWDAGTIELNAGQRVPIRMEYYKNGNGGEAHLYWSTPSRPEQVISAGRVFGGIEFAEEGGSDSESGSCGALGLEVLLPILCVAALRRRRA